MPQYPKCSWKKITIGSKALTRHQSIQWLAMHKKLTTVDRLRKGGISVATDCVLYEKSIEETMEHLYFECDYFGHLWATLLKWLGETHTIGSWNAETEWLEKRSSSRVRAQLVRFLYAAVVYHVWVERNQRRFQDKKITSQQRIKFIILELHTRGQKEMKWQKELDKLNYYPS
ncbi:PREDICTED: uncharacterized protein LOC109228116 [Nicotiana attenuata]|uniref:uncharacterized protein LOC109228116 n=1 Tax=Nicotiana attenuata TaxID=49451 RepID=UPI0009048102|nr:PREDICTED: uncharacterized protein LOC109228116 [Nicotiana attenuata]